MVLNQRLPLKSYINSFQNEKFLPRYKAVQLGEVISSGVSKTSHQHKIYTCKPRSALPKLVTISIFIAICYTIYTLRLELAIRESELVSIRLGVDHVEDVLSRNEGELNSTDAALGNLNSRFIHLLPFLAADWDQFTTRMKDISGDALYKKVLDRSNAMESRVHELEDSIASSNYFEAIEHFESEKNYKLQVNLRTNRHTVSFVVEMAPIELMPRSVNYFMNMAKAEAWDNFLFKHNSNNTLIAEINDSKGYDKRDLFTDHIQSLSFPEYIEDYPHHKYTLGFDGSGSGFYINTEDNRKVMKADYDSGAKPGKCFGKVIQGQDVIDWMKSHPIGTYTEIESIRTIR